MLIRQVSERLVDLQTALHIQEEIHREQAEYLRTVKGTEDTRLVCQGIELAHGRAAQMIDTLLSTDTPQAFILRTLFYLRDRLAVLQRFHADEANHLSGLLGHHRVSVMNRGLAFGYETIIGKLQRAIADIHKSICELRRIQRAA